MGTPFIWLLGVAIVGVLGYMFRSSLAQLFKKWYGEFSREELIKYVLLGITFALIIGTYWTLRALKDTILTQYIIGFGSEAKASKQIFLALAKVVSLVLLFPVVIGYSKLVDKYPKHKLFYVLGTIYTVLLAGWTLLFLHPTLGLSIIAPSVWNLQGWLWYVFVESFGSLIVALFWAFTTDISDPQSAKRGFALVYMIGQLGGIFMPRLGTLPQILGTTNWIVVAMCTVSVMLIMAIMRYFVSITPKEQLQGYKSKKAHEHVEEPGFFEGLKLLVSHKYLLGIFAVLSIFEIIVTIIDFNFKTLAMSSFSDPAALNAFLSQYASSVNLVAFICLALGINNIQRWLGIRTALALVPLIVGGAFLTFYFYPNVGVLFYIMIGAKAINYALNGPSLKQLYVPTSEDAKYKSQAWIETFGSRSAKATGSFFNMTKGFGTNMYFLIALVGTLGLVGLWFAIALYLGSEYNKAIDKGTIVC